MEPKLTDQLISIMVDLQMQTLKNQITILAALSRICSQVGSTLGEAAVDQTIDENTNYLDGLTKKINKLVGLDE